MEKEETMTLDLQQLMELISQMPDGASVCLLLDGEDDADGQQE